MPFYSLIVILIVTLNQRFFLRNGIWDLMIYIKYITYRERKYSLIREQIYIYIYYIHFAYKYTKLTLSPTPHFTQDKFYWEKRNMIILAHLSNITLFSTINKKSHKTFTDGKKYPRRHSTPLMKPFTRVQKRLSPRCQRSQKDSH